MKTIAFTALLAGLIATSAQAETRVIILGSGTPVPNGERAGAGVAVIHDGEAYIFDAGHGTVQRAVQAWKTMDAPELNPPAIRQVFLSHLHSDHTLDYSELAATYWWRREARLNAYGPKGLQAMTDGYYAMQEVDIALRTGGNQPVSDPTMYQVAVTEIAQDGVIFDQNGVTVEAFSVPHGDIKPAYGYKITTPDKTIVFSGDTAYSELLTEKARGVDVLIHEVISEEGWGALEPDWQEYHHSSHTLTSELARIAIDAQPGVLVLSHILHYGAPIETALTEVQALYDGNVVLASDLDEF
ncbi:Beta-lactamase superfamily domain-containing protein [Paracoccus halophilus]|uniref:Beta-lactamase n=1 Tax=Paracoccus halophilus TaxID=376733 RepID=A0A099F6H5_9RHOB|nr:MBL fold metallo-hydrolase [Paracoccus halophilus]KGJ05856.1 beta-lactamase [Paracoccus halophilus]SFA40670.1 Beta-lactamase superfamily domain-containing protein [Paracoccus halophilus]